MRKLKEELKALKEAKPEEEKQPVKVKMINYRLSKKEEEPEDELARLTAKRSALLKGGMYKATDRLIQEIDEKIAKLHQNNY